MTKVTPKSMSVSQQITTIIDNVKEAENNNKPYTDLWFDLLSIKAEISYLLTEKDILRNQIEELDSLIRP